MQRDDTQLAIFIGNTEFFIGKLRQYCDGVTEDKMMWTPAGMTNPLSWILQHCTGLLWLTYGRVTDTTIPADVERSGIAWGYLKDAKFEENASAPMMVSAGTCMTALDEGWEILKRYLTIEPREWESLVLTVERKERSVWTLLWHNLNDVCYHSGQASSLRKLLAAECR